MLSQQYQVPDWELQLQGLIARNSTIREASPTTPSCHFSQPHPHQHWDMPNTVSPTSASQLKPESLEGSKQQSRTDRALSMVRKEVEKQGNVMDIVRGQLAAFSNEFSSNRLTAESFDAKISSHGRLLKSLQSEENTTKMRLKAVASDITILQRQQSETKELTASLFCQMQQELSDLKANVQVLRDDNALMKEQLDAVGVNQPFSCSPIVTLNDRIKTIVAAAVATHSSELERATAQSIQKLESDAKDQSDIISKDMDALERRVTSAVDKIVNNDITIHLSQAKESSKESETLFQLANDLQNDVSERMDSLYMYDRRDELQTMIAKEKASERLCRLERRQNIIEEQLYEQSSATISAGPLCSTHDKNDLFGDAEQNWVEEMPSENMSNSSAGHDPLLVSAAETPNQFFLRKSNQAPITSRSNSHKKRASQEEGAVHQAPEWLHGAVIEELKNKFTHEKEHRDTNW